MSLSSLVSINELLNLFLNKLWQKNPSRREDIIMFILEIAWVTVAEIALSVSVTAGPSEAILCDKKKSAWFEKKSP